MPFQMLGASISVSKQTEEPRAAVFGANLMLNFPSTEEIPALTRRNGLRSSSYSSSEPDSQKCHAYRQALATCSVSVLPPQKVTCQSQLVTGCCWKTRENSTLVNREDGDHSSHTLWFGTY